MESRKVVIVGAGPAGMALAYLLARRGVEVSVLEAHHDFARAFRGEGLLPLLPRTGLVQRLYRRHQELTSRGVVPVRLTV